MVDVTQNDQQLVLDLAMILPWDKIEDCLSRDIGQLYVSHIIELRCLRSVPGLSLLFMIHKNENRRDASAYDPRLPGP